MHVSNSLILHSHGHETYTGFHRNGIYLNWVNLWDQFKECERRMRLTSSRAVSTTHFSTGWHGKRARYENMVREYWFEEYEVGNGCRVVKWLLNPSFFVFKHFKCDPTQKRVNLENHARNDLIILIVLCVCPFQRFEMRRIDSMLTSTCTDLYSNEY